MHFFEERYFEILVNLTKAQLTRTVKKIIRLQNIVCT